jgi:hypothetical protein
MLGLNRISKQRDSPRFVAIVALIFLLIYVLWIGGPYLRSIAVRDAAITTWIASARSPIAGFVEYAPDAAGERVGADGRIAVVTNPRVSGVDLVRAEAALDRSRSELAALNHRIDALSSIVADRATAADTYDEAFRADVAAEIDNLRVQIAEHRAALTLEQIEADRLASMRDSGASSQSEADEARVTVIDRRRQLAHTETALLRAEQRLAAAAAGAFLSAVDIADAGDARRSLGDAKIALEQARAELGPLQAEVNAQQVVLDTIRLAYEKSRTATIFATEGAMVWSLLVGSGTEVQPGAIIATWVDCGVMLVDAPISDLEAGLILPDMPAHVTLEGEDRVREGRVLFTRGAAAVLAHDDLAAVAKGRRSNTGQAIIQLVADAADVEECPIGRAAFVDFPGVSVIDMIAARLRL